MPRTRKKAEKPIEAPFPEKAVAEVSRPGPGETLSTPAPAPVKRRVATRSKAGPTNPEENGARESVKPGSQQDPVVETAGPSVSPAQPLPSPEKAEQSEALDRQLREARGLFESLAQQCQEVRSLFEGASRERLESNREFEGLRQTAQEVQGQLLRDAVESRQVHERLSNEAETNASLVRGEISSAAEQFAEASRHFHEARQQFFRGFEEEVGWLHKQLREAGQLFQELPRQAEEFRQRLLAAEAPVRGFEEAASAVRQKREAIDQEMQLALRNLETVRNETTEANHQLTAVRMELEIGQARLDEVKEQLERATERATERAPHGSENGESSESGGRNRLGITVDAGVVVSEVVPGSPAAVAGLTPGDIISRVDGTPVLNGPKLRDLIQHKDASEEVILHVARGETATEVRAHLDGGEGTSGEDRNQLGATVKPGAIVAEVAPGTPAASAGLRRGDVITAVNGAPVLTGAQLRQAVQALEDHAEVRLEFTREGRTLEVDTRLDEMVGVP